MNDQSEQEIENLWGRILSEIQRIVASQVYNLNADSEPPKKQIFLEVERKLRRPLPATVVSSFQARNGFYSRLFEDYFSLYTLEHSLEIWQSFTNSIPEFQEYDLDTQTSCPPEIKKRWWNPHWLPLGDDSQGEYFCVDLDPTAKGNVGQIIRFGKNEGIRTLIAPSWKEFLNQLAEDLSSDCFEFSENDMRRVKGTSRFWPER